MLPELEFPSDPSWFIPSEAQCAELWKKYSVPPHICAHCRAVASVAVEITSRALKGSVIPPHRPLSVPLALAAGLLHDIAKSYTIHYGGSHAQLGAAWVREETGNPLLAQAVLFHVEWPWAGGVMDDVRDPMRLPVIVAYADKRVRHNAVVSLKERFDDLVVRYGISQDKQAMIAKNYAHAQAVEQAIFERVGRL